jgi:hypothetical protein
VIFPLLLARGKVKKKAGFSSLIYSKNKENFQLLKAAK